MQAQKILADRYELVQHLARGGMADVYEASDLLLGRRVAVKVLHSQLASDDAFVRRFRREAQAAANLSHPNIVAIYDWGQDDAGTYFIVMELIEGKTLRDILRTEGPLLSRRAAEVAAEAASALAVAHRAGLVHRDVKPGNIMLTPEGNVKVTDFGIARAWDDSSELTRTGAVIGTATYFSPEQAQGHPADERSDIYALGVVLYEMLTGQPPFSGETPVAVAYQHVSAAPPLPSDRNPDVPSQLDSVVMSAMEKAPEHRYQTADELREDLLRVLQAQPVGARRQDETSQTRMLAPLPPPTVPPDETYREVAEEGPGGQRLFVLTVVGLLLALALGLFALTRLLSSPPAGPELVAIPNLEGWQEEDARVELQSLGFRVRTTPETSEDVEAGLVLRTDPPAGEELARDEFVTLFVSAGEEVAPIPSVVGLTLERATSLIEAQDFEVGDVTEAADDEIEAGRVVSQDPAPPGEAAPGTRIHLVVSTGPESFEMPDLEGRSEADALFQLARLGLEQDQVLIQEEFSTEVAEGFVIRTEPEQGTPMSKDDSVTLVVSRGPEQVVVPDLDGMTESEARQRLESVGLQLAVDPQRVSVDDEDDHDRVVQQSPQAGREIAEGSTVTVRLGQYVEPTTTTTTSTTAPPGDDD